MTRLVHRALLTIVAATLTAPGLVGAQTCFDVKVFAGRGVGDGGPATSALLLSPRNVVLDAAGNILIADAGNARVRRIDPAGTITTIAGNGAPGVADDGAQATITTLKEPSGVAVFGTDVYIADVGGGVNTVWRLSADGIIHRFAGSGVATGSIDGEGGDPADDLNDGQLATFATLNLPVRVAVDASGNVYISDFGNNRVRRVDVATGRISTAIGSLNRPIGIAVGLGTDLFVANTGTHQILKGSTSSSAAGAFVNAGGVPGLANDQAAPIPAISAPLNGAAEVAVDGAGVVYIGDTNNNVIHKVTTDGMMRRIAGSAIAGFQDGPDFLARFRSPGVALGAGNTLLIPDVDNNRIRRFDPAPASGINVTTIAGGDNSPGDGAAATAAVLNRPAGLAQDAGGGVIITEHDSHRVRRVDTAGVISTIVNQDGLNDAAADGTSALTSPLRQPTGVAIDATGQLLIADAQDHRVLVVGADGLIRTFAGTSATPGAGGDNGPANVAQLNTPLRMAVASDGSVFIADFNNNRIRKVDPAGMITTFTGASGELNQPAGLVFDGAGNLIVADFGSHRVLRVDPNGAVSVVAGSGTPAYLGDGGAAGTAALNGPTDVAFTSDGGLLIVDQLNNVVRRVAPGGDGSVSATSTITTLIGSGTPGFADGTGRAASFLFPTDVLVDSSGNILLADRGNQRVRIATPGAVCRPEDLGGCAGEPAGCIAGGGPARTDCLAELLVKGLQPGQARPVVRCRDNDACDFDPSPGRCTFRVASCLNESGCPVSGLTRFLAKGRAAGSLLQIVGDLPGASRAGNAILFSQPFSTASACTATTDISVGLRKGGRKPGKLKLKTVAFGSGRRTKDPDNIRLLCTP